MTNAALTSANGLSAPIRRAIIYTRVSSDKAGGRSVREQESECRTECERRGWPVAEVLTDNDRSASRYATKDRPEYARLRTLLQPGDVLVMWEASRATRDLERYVELRELLTERRALWCYSGKVYDLTDGGDRFSTGLDILVSEKAAEETRDRIMRAHRANLVNGKPHGRLSYGYRTRLEQDDQGRIIARHREPDPARAPLVAEAARRVLAGETTLSVLRWLVTVDPDTAKWNTTRLHKMLASPTNAGWRVTPDGELIKGTWEPIIDEETRLALVAMFAARKTGPRGNQPKHLLSGIAVCAICGDALWRTKGGKAHGGNHYVYGCKKGKHVARSVIDLDAAVLEVVNALLADPVMLAEWTRPPEADPTVAVRLAKLIEQRDGVEAQLAEMKMPAASGARVLAKLEEQIAAAEKAVVPVAVDPAVAEIADSDDPIATWEALPLLGKRTFIRAVMSVTVDRIGPGRWHDRRRGIDIEPRRAAA